MRPGLPKRRILSFWQVIITLVITMLVAALLMAQPLDSAAKNIDSGPLRALARVITAPIAAVSGTLRIDKFYEWANGKTDEVATTVTTVTNTPVTDPPTTVSTTVPSGTTTTVARPVFTSANPLRIFLAGDSLMIEVGHAFTRKAESLTSIDLYRINKVSSGFATPEFYNWPKQIQEVVAEFAPTVTVMMFGGNEKVPMTIDGTKVQPFTDVWNAEYKRRVKEGIKIVTDSGSIVIWVGMPNMRSDKFAETARTLNDIYKQIASEDPLVFYIDAYALFSDENGEYSAYLPDSNGDTQLIREDDGIHFTAAGGDRMVEAILEKLSHGFDLR